MWPDLGLLSRCVQRETSLSRTVAASVAAKVDAQFEPSESRARATLAVWLANLTTEHPTLAATAAELLAHVDRWSDEVLPAQSASAWVHHGEFARRTEQLAGHLEATLALAEEGRFPSAFAVARTALEHHLLDRLLLLADRYEEIVRPPDPELVEEWEQAWVQKTEQWTRDVVSVERVRNGRALRLVRLGHKVRDDAGNVREQISPYAFLSAFAHATKSGYEVDRRPYPNSPPAPHVLGELALLYVATIAVSELRSWAAYLERRAQLLAPLSSTITELASRAGDVIAYFWFLGGHPSPSTTARRPTAERTRSTWPVSPARSILRSCSPTTLATTQTPSIASNACTPANGR